MVNIMRASATNLLLLAVVIVLLLVALYEPGIDVPVTPEKLFPLSGSEVNEITIHNGEQQPIILKRESTTVWRMVEPIAVAANGYKVESVLDILDEQPTNRFAVDGAKLASYGLDKPQVRLMLGGSNGEQKLQFGSQTPLNSYRYLQFENEIVTIKDSAFYPVASLYTNFIASRLLPEGAQFTSIQLPDFQLRLIDGVWTVEAQKEEEAIGKVLSADQWAAWIDGWRYASSVDIEPIKMEEVSVEKQEMVVITLKSGTKLRWTISLSDDGLILGRPDLGIEYHMSDSQHEALFLPPQPEPQQEENAGTA